MLDRPPPTCAKRGLWGPWPHGPSQPQAHILRVHKATLKACGFSLLKTDFGSQLRRECGVSGRREILPHLGSLAGSCQPLPALRTRPEPWALQNFRPLLALLPRTALRGGARGPCTRGLGTCQRALLPHRHSSPERGLCPLTRRRVGSRCPPTCLPSPGGSWLALSGKLGDLSNAAALFPKETFPGSCPSLLPTG